MAHEDLMPSSTEDVNILLVPSLREIIQSMDRQTLQKLHIASSSSPTSQASLLQPIAHSPTLVQVACTNVVQGGMICKTSGNCKHVFELSVTLPPLSMYFFCWTFVLQPVFPHTLENDDC